LTGEYEPIGGHWSTKDLHLKVKLLPQGISRIHLLILPDFTAFDVRSTNGTTVNAEFLPYAQPRILGEGDIIVVVGIVAFQLQMPIYRLLLPWPPPVAPQPPKDVSGMLVDGRAKAISYLRIGESFVTLDEHQRLIVENVKTNMTLLTIRIESNGQITLEPDQSASPWARIPMEMIWKENDYHFPSAPMQPGQQYTLANNISKVPNVVFHLVYNEKTIPFQIVPIVPGLKLESD
jgi:hypothetical protein